MIYMNSFPSPKVFYGCKEKCVVIETIQFLSFFISMLYILLCLV